MAAAVTCIKLVLCAPAHNTKLVMSNRCYVCGQRWIFTHRCLQCRRAHCLKCAPNVCLLSGAIITVSLDDTEDACRLLLLGLLRLSLQVRAERCTLEPERALFSLIDQPLDDDDATFWHVPDRVGAERAVISARFSEHIASIDVRPTCFGCTSYAELVPCERCGGLFCAACSRRSPMRPYLSPPRRSVVEHVAPLPQHANHLRWTLHRWPDLYLMPCRAIRTLTHEQRRCIDALWREHLQWEREIYGLP